MAKQLAKTGATVRYFQLEVLSYKQLLMDGVTVTYVFPRAPELGEDLYRE